MKKIISIILLLLIISLSQSGLAKSGIYITATGGWASQGKMPASLHGNSADTKHFPAVRLGVGYLHDLNEIFGLGLEVAGGWYRGAKYNLTDRQIKAFSSTTEFLAVFVLHLKSMDYFIKIGGNRHTLNGFRKIVDNGKVSETKIQPQMAVGLSYNFNEHFALTSEYIHSFGGKVDNFVENSLKCPSINAVLVGARVAFW